MGGLLDSLYIFGFIVMQYFINFGLHAKLLSKLFRYKGSDEGLLMRQSSSKKIAKLRNQLFNESELEEKSLLDHIKKDF